MKCDTDQSVSDTIKYQIASLQRVVTVLHSKTTVKCEGGDNCKMLFSLSFCYPPPQAPASWDCKILSHSLSFSVGRSSSIQGIWILVLHTQVIRITRPACLRRRPPAPMPPLFQRFTAWHTSLGQGAGERETTPILFVVDTEDISSLVEAALHCLGNTIASHTSVSKHTTA